MPAVNKVGTQLMVSPHIRNRILALTILRHESTAEVYRTLIENQLPIMEHEFARPLHDLREVLTFMKVPDFNRAVETMVQKRIRYEDLFYTHGGMRETFPVDLD